MQSYGGYEAWHKSTQIHTTLHVSRTISYLGGIHAHRDQSKYIYIGVENYLGNMRPHPSVRPNIHTYMSRTIYTYMSRTI